MPIWLCRLRLVMLWMKSACFDESACARLSENVPVTEKSPFFCSALSLPSHVQGSSPEMSRGPEYGDCELPRGPKKRSFTSKAPLPNWVELKLSWTSSG